MSLLCSCSFSTVAPLRRAQNLGVSPMGKKAGLEQIGRMGPMGPMGSDRSQAGRVTLVKKTHCCGVDQGESNQIKPAVAKLKVPSSKFKVLSNSVRPGQTRSQIRPLRWLARWRFGSPSPWPLPLERVSVRAALVCFGRGCWNSQSGPVKPNQTFQMARPHPALSPWRGCLVGPRRVCRMRLLERSVRPGQTKSNQFRPFGWLACWRFGSPSPCPLPQERVSGGAALGVPDEVAGTVSQARSNQFRPFKWLALTLPSPPGEGVWWAAQGVCRTRLLERSVRPGQTQSNHSRVCRGLGPRADFRWNRVRILLWMWRLHQ